MNLVDAHREARIVNDDALRLGCSPPVVVVSYGDEHTIEINGHLFVRYERARFRRAIHRERNPFT